MGLHPKQAFSILAMSHVFLVIGWLMVSIQPSIFHTLHREVAEQREIIPWHLQRAIMVEPGGSRRLRQTLVR